MRLATKKVKEMMLEAAHCDREVCTEKRREDSKLQKKMLETVHHGREFIDSLE